MITAMKNSKSNHIFVVFLLICMISSCVSSNWGHFSQIQLFSNEASQQIAPSFTLTNRKYSHFQESQSLSESKTAVSLIRERLRRSRVRYSGDFLFSMAGCIACILLLDLFSIFLCFLLKKSDLTPRYSIITYLHRSDGKKSASLTV